MAMMGKKKKMKKMKSGNDPHAGGNMSGMKKMSNKKRFDMIKKDGAAKAKKAKGYDPHATMDKQKMTAKKKMM